MLKKQSWLLPVILAGLVVSMVLTIMDWNTFKTYYDGMLIVDNAAVAFSTVLIFSAFLIFSLAARYYRGVQRPLDDIYGVMIFALVGAVMMTSYNNLVMLFLGIETLSIAIYVLAGSHKEAVTSNEAILKYFLLGSFMSGFLLFGILILVREAHGNDLFTSMNGLGKSNPAEAFCLTVSMLSLTGIPPLAGFMAKYYLFAAALEKGLIWLVIIAIAGSAISVTYYFKPVIAMYLEDFTGVELKVERFYRIHLLFMTLMVILIGLLPFLLVGIL
jgi:NADH:ubiquinone oxidoreductase subunit 2 (subunit N)